MNTETLINDMLKENTGTHFLDSGGNSNRNWQRNKDIDFKGQPSVEFDIYNDEIDYTINVFHYLKNANLELDHICDTFNELQDKHDNWNGTGNLTECYGVSEQACNYLNNNHEVQVLSTWNTYNGETSLSQVLQGSYLDINGESYVLFQIHGGADVRGGYTNAKLFKMEFFQEWLPCENVYGTIDGIQVDNMWNGYSLTDESGNDVPVNKNSKVEIYLMEA